MLVGKLKYLEKNEKENAEKSNSSIKSNFIDNEIFESALEDTQLIKESIMERDEETPFFKKLSSDIFHAMFKPRPEVIDKGDVYDSLKMEHDILNELASNEKFEKLRNNTAGDIFNSTLSLGAFQDKAYEIIQEWTEKSKENQEAMDKMNNAIGKQDELQKLLEEMLYDPNNQDLKNQANDLNNEINNLNQQVEQSPGMSGNQGLKQQLQNAVNEMEKEVQEAQDALENFGMSNKGGTGDGNEIRIPFEQKKRLVEALSKSQKLRQITEQLGRVRQAVGKVGKKPSKFGQVVCDIGTGNNIKKSLSTEKAKLLDKDLELDFFKRYMDKNLLEYKTQGVEENKGPIVICLDLSGSMKGNREHWAKGVSIATLQLAMAQKRDFRCICFCSDVRYIYDFAKNDYNLDRMIDFAEYFPGGGTNFERPLIKALESIEESKFKKADILFITDGEPNNFLSESFKQKFKAVKENKGFMVQSILIGSSNTRYLKEFSDEIIPLNNLNKNDELVNIFKNMQDK